MCNFFKIYPSPRINRRKRKFLAALSLTSGLTMLLMAHQTSLISPLESPIYPFVPATNDTPVDYFVAPDGHPTTDIVRNYRTTPNHKNRLLNHLPSSSERPSPPLTDDDDVHPSEVWEASFPEELLTTNNLPTCCGEDFHQDPYVTKPTTKPKFYFKKASLLPSDSDKPSLLSSGEYGKKSQFDSNANRRRGRSQTTQTADNWKLKKNTISGGRRRRKKIKRKLKGSKAKDQEKEAFLSNYPSDNPLMSTTSSSLNEIFPSEYFTDENDRRREEEEEEEGELESEKTSASSSFGKNGASIIDIPEITFTNVSFVSLKRHKLNQILNQIDIGKIFTNVAYRKSILSRDLSQWTDLLSLPEDGIRNTYEPNKVIENYEYRTGRPGSTESTDQDGDLVPKSATRQAHKFSLGYLKIKNNFPNQILRELPRQRIRKSFRIRAREKNSSLIRGENQLASELKKANDTRQFFQHQRSLADYRNVLYPFHLDYTRPAYFPWKSTKDECTNHATRFLVGGTGKIVPLASFPGSGNTWLRYISETLTGIFSGSLYEDDILAVRGFWGERDSYIEGTTLLQKAHGFPALSSEVTEWDGRMILGPAPRKILLLIRSPYEALVSLRHFHAAGHTGFGHHSAFSGIGWDNFTEVRAESWLKLNKAWLEMPNSKVLVIHYEMLMQNLENDAKRLLRFLGIPMDYGRLSCLQRYPEGKFRRPRYPKHLQGYQISRKAATMLASAITSLNQVLATHGHATLPTQLYSYHPPTKAPPDTNTPNNSIHQNNMFFS